MKLYRKQPQLAISARASPGFTLCYNSTVFSNSSPISMMYGVKRLKWLAVLPAVFGLLVITSCGGGNGSSNTPASKVQHRSLISNTFSGNLQVVDIQNDTTQYTPSTTTSTGQVVPGVPVTVPAGTSVTFEAVSS